MTEWILTFETNLCGLAEELCNQAQKVLTGQGALTVRCESAPSDPLSQKARREAKAGQVVCLREGDRVAIHAETDILLWRGLHCLIADEKILNDGLQTMDFGETSADGWMLPVPLYADGCRDEIFYNCSGGLKPDGQLSWMHVMRETTAEAFRAYVNSLKALGYTAECENAIDGNLFFGFSDRLGAKFYTYYRCRLGEDRGDVRLIHDRNSTATLKELCYETEGSENSEFFMFNFNTGGEDTFLIRAADNSWIVIDGGVTRSGNIDPEGLFGTSMYEFMRRKSGLSEDEKLVISCWYMTHAHRDHFLAFHAMIDNCHDRIDLQRVVFNAPEPEVATHDVSQVEAFRACKRSINAYYPDVAYLKVHPGMKLRFADVEFQVLYTLDDLTDFWISKHDIYYKVWCTCFALPVGDPNKTVYRDWHKNYNFNNSSTISLISVNGLRVLALGDAFRGDTWLLPYYSSETLHADAIKIEHHFIDFSLIPYYRECISTGEPLFAFVPRVKREDYQTFADKRFSPDEFDASKGQIFQFGRLETIFGLQKKDGKVLKNEYDALFSFEGGINKL